MTAAICTVDDIKLYLSIAEEDDGDDELLAQIVDAVNEWIENETGRIFADPGVDATRYFRKDRIDRNGILWVDTDLASITSITNGDGETIDTDDIETWPLNETPIMGIRILDSSSNYWNFSYNDSKVAVTGRWAYSLTVPSRAKQAAIRLAAWTYRQKDNAADIDRPILTGDGSVLMPSRFPDDIATWLEGMRKHFG